MESLTISSSSIYDCALLTEALKSMHYVKGYDERGLAVLGSFPRKVRLIFDLLRSDPRFADLLRRMNLQPCASKLRFRDSAGSH